MHIDALWKRQCPQVSMDLTVLTCSKIILLCTCLHCLLSIVLFELSSYLRWQRYRLAKRRAGCHSRWRTALCQLCQRPLRLSKSLNRDFPIKTEMHHHCNSQIPSIQRNPTDSYGILRIPGIPDGFGADIEASSRWRFRHRHTAKP
jgi:hypothetical protein